LKACRSIFMRTPAKRRRNPAPKSCSRKATSIGFSKKAGCHSPRLRIRMPRGWCASNRLPGPRERSQGAGHRLLLVIRDPEMAHKRSRKTAIQLQSLTGDIGPDDIFRHYSRKKVALNIGLLPLDKGEEGTPSILIEGDANTLVFLADLLLAQVRDSDCST